MAKCCRTHNMHKKLVLRKGDNLDDCHRVWVFLWDLDMSPKVQLFLRRYFTMSLPTKGVLRHRHLIVDGGCPWCPSAKESIHHAIFACQRIRRLWEDLSCHTMAGPDDVVNGCDVLEIWKSLDKKIMERGYYLAWNIYNDRNKFVFEGCCSPPVVLCQRVTRQVEEFKDYTTRIYGRPRVMQSSGSKKWHAPSANSIKLNIDAYLIAKGWVMRLYVVARDSTSDVLFSTVRRVHAHWPSDVGECKAVWLAVHLAKAYDLMNVIIESDSQVVTNRLSKEALFFWDLDSIL